MVKDKSERRLEETRFYMLSEGEVITNLGPISDQIAKGKGSIGKLLREKQLYDNINKLISEMSLLIKEVRKDPKKYLRIKISVF